MTHLMKLQIRISITIAINMVGVQDETISSGSGSAMDTENLTKRHADLQKLLRMTTALFVEAAMVSVEIVGKEKLTPEESALLREVENNLFSLLHQVAIGQLPKKLRKYPSVYHALEQRYPLEISVIDPKKLKKKNLKEKRLKKTAKAVEKNGASKDSTQQDAV